MGFHLPKVIYCWIASHIGIYANKKVDLNAKESLNLEMTDFKITFNKFKPFINKYGYNKWQTLWNEMPLNQKVVRNRTDS